MNRQIRNAITSLMVTAIVGIGLMAFGQNPCCPQPVVVQPVQPTVQTVTVTQDIPVPACPAPCPCPQPVACPAPCPCPPPVTVAIPAPVTCPEPCPQPVAIPACPQPCPQPVSYIQAQGFVQTVGYNAGTVDYDLAKRIERNADELRKYFRRSLRCIDCCVDDSYYDSVKAFEKATDRLRHDAKHDDCPTCAQAQEVLQLASCISAYMDPCNLCPEVLEAWTELQCDLQALASSCCTSVAFQPPTSLCPSCPVPVVPVQPVQFVQPTCAQPVAVPACPEPCPAPSGVIFK
jgi:hypothetical protein